MRTTLKLTCLLVAFAGIAAVPTSASAEPYAPPTGQVYQGINDTAVAQDFADYSRLIGKPHLPVVQAFHTWGTDPKQALDRWLTYKARGVLSISTAAGWGYPEVITPQGIAEGDGDAYLLTLNSRIAASGQITYLRPLAEMNNWHNAYSALSSGGASKGASHSQANYKLAWQRMYIVVKGGGTLAEINARLSALGMPGLKSANKAPLPAALPAAPVAFIWCPLVYGSPNVTGNKPIAYWPGPEYVDWVGTDTYSKYPAFKYLSRHYKLFKGKPFAIGEWGIQDAEAPRFAKKLFRWQLKHKRVKMMLYHASFVGKTGPLSLFRYPRSARVVRRAVRNSFTFPAFTPEWVGKAASPAGPEGNQGRRSG